MDDDDAFNEYSRTLLSSRNLMYSILTVLEQQEQTLQRLAVTAALRRASQGIRNDSESETETTEPPRQRRRTTIYGRTRLQSPIQSSVRFRRPPVSGEAPADPIEEPTANNNDPAAAPAPTSDDNEEELRPRRPPPSRHPRPTQNNPISNLFTQAILNTLGQLSPVRVTPSASQIERATERMTFGELPDEITRYQTCPICHDAFTADSDIIRIRHCGHYFSREAILTWFDMNCHCPICRHDIREGVSPSNSNSSQDDETSHHEEYLESSGETSIPISNTDDGIAGIVDAITQDLHRRTPGRDIGPVSYSFEFVPTIQADLRPRAGLPSRRSAYPNNITSNTSETSYLPDHLTSNFNIPNTDTTNQTSFYNRNTYTSTYNRDYSDPSGNYTYYNNNTTS